MRQTAILTMTALALSAFRQGDEWEKREARDPKGAKLPYRLYKPKGATGKERLPLVLFLHGAGERGDDNDAQLKNGVRFFVANQAQFPCFIAAPQCPAKFQWVDTPWGNPKHTMPAQPTEPLRLAIEMVSSLEKEFPIDPKRLYVTGLSMGGFGTWDVIQRYPKRFAAAVPVCGGADEAAAGLIAKVPVWVFHGGSDDVVKTARSRNIVEALKKAGGSPKYTEYPGVGHGCWDQAYQEKELFPWLFGQKLP
jgi:predicted peptidase